RPPDGIPTSRSPHRKTPPAAVGEAGEAGRWSSMYIFRYRCTACPSRRTGPWHARTRSKSSSRYHSLRILQAGLQVPRAELGLLSLADARRVDYRGPVKQIPALRGVENAPMRDGPPGTRRLREQDGDLVFLDGRVVNGGVFPGSGVIDQLHSFIRIADRFGEIRAIRIRLGRGKTNVQLVRHVQRLATIQRIQNRRFRRIRQSHFYPLLEIVILSKLVSATCLGPMGTFSRPVGSGLVPTITSTSSTPCTRLAAWMSAVHITSSPRPTPARNSPRLSMPPTYRMISSLICSSPSAGYAAVVLTTTWT